MTDELLDAIEHRKQQLAQKEEKVPKQKREKKETDTITMQIPKYILPGLKNILTGELKRCKNGKWDTKQTMVTLLLEVFSPYFPEGEI